jgi:O-antigen biosynthesis protein
VSTEAPSPTGHICFVTDDFGGLGRGAGVGTEVLLTSRLLVQRRWDVHVLFCGPVEDEQARATTTRRLAQEKISFVWLDREPAPAWLGVPSFGDGVDTIATSQRALEALQRLHGELRFDIIEFSAWRALGFRAAQAKRAGIAFTDVRLAVKLHSTTEWERRGNLQSRRSPWELQVEHCERYAFEHADLQLSPSRHMIADTRDQGWAIRSDAVVAHPLPEGRDSARPRATDIQELVFAGRLEPRKGLGLVLDALDGLSGNLPILFLGRDCDADGRNASDVIAERMAGRPHRIETGLDHDATIAEVAADGRLAVLAPQSDSLVTVAECIAAEIPFLAPDIGGTAEVIDHVEGRTRWLFEPTAKGLVAALERRLVSPADEERELRSAAAAACDADGRNDLTEATYRALLARSATRPERRPSIPADATVTVAVTHYNHPDYLPAALASIANQTRAPDEVIVIDDGSSQEAARRVFAEQEAMYPGWTFLRQHNEGPGAARNVCLTRSGSTYFLPFDSDNIADPALLETLLIAALVDGRDAASCHMLGFVEEDDIPAGRFAFRFAPTGGPRLLTLLENVFGDTCGLFRSEALRAVGGFETERWSPHEDWETYTKLAFAGFRVDVVPRVLFFYRAEVGGRLDGLTSDPARAYRLGRRMIRDLLADVEFDRDERVALCECLVGFAAPQSELQRAHDELADWAHQTIEDVHAWREAQLEELREFLSTKLDEATVRAERAEAALAASRAADNGGTPPSAADVSIGAGLDVLPRTPILYLAPWVDLGGSDKGTIDWFRHIDRTRFAPSIITTQPSLNRWLGQVEPYAEEVWALPDTLSGAQIPLFILGFIESRGIRVIHLMNSRIGFDLLPDIAGLAKPPAVVVQLHAEEPDRSGYVRYAATRYGNVVDAFSVTSEQLREALLDFDVPRSRTHVIRTGVDAAEEFNPEKVAPLEDLGSGPHVLWPGRLTAQKDPMLTLEVLAELKRREVSLRLHIVGDGDLEADVRAQAADLRVDDLLRWHQPSREMPRWYRSCDLVLMTSAFEGVPYVIYEALAMGVPVVAPALAGNVELAGGNGAVALIEPRDDAVGYADAVQRLLRDRARRDQVGAAARQRMLRGFDVQTMTRLHEDLYDRLLHDRGSRAVMPGPPPPARGQLSAPPLPPAFRFDRSTVLAPTVAVIMPCYQHGRFLGAAIESARAQTLVPTRIIVVDDGSRDEETLVALAEAEHDELVTVIRLEHNRGPSAARNRALDLVEENYVLPLDADDLLLPTALADMVEQLERAPQDIGFVYPNVQHFGNRHDHYVAPAYNLHLLLDNNYCAASALFDSRLFKAGIRYHDDIVFGHEDWDLVLTMAEHGVHGEPATADSFLYRKRGFSRVNSVDFGPNSFRQVIQARHPQLYRRRDEIKARWAPAFSLVLVDAENRGWTVDLLGDLCDQTCRDFEVVAATADQLLPLDVRRMGRAGACAAIECARGRFVCVVLPDGAGAVARRTFVEHMIRAFGALSAPGPIILAMGDTVGGGPLRQLAPEQRPLVTPVGAAWERPPGFVAPLVEVGCMPNVVEDLVLTWELAQTGLQWRSA